MSDLGKEGVTGEPFDFKKNLQTFLADAEIFDGFYKVELEQGVPPENIESQAGLQVRYRSTTHNEVGDDAINQLFVPKTVDIKVGISAPPAVPFVIDEYMPQDLWEVVKSGDPSRAPTIDELKRVEISVECTNTFYNGSERKTDEIYRIDLTKDKPVVYRREPIPENEQQKHDGLGYEDKTLTAFLDFVQPFPRFRYEKIEKAGELERIIGIVDDCSRSQLQVVNKAIGAG